MLSSETEYARRKLRAIASTLEDLTSHMTGANELNLLLSAQTLVAKLHLAVNERAMKSLEVERRRPQND